jgi:hypothetical protein
VDKIVFERNSAVTPPEVGTMPKKLSERVNGKGGANWPRIQRQFRDWRNFDPSKVVGDRTLIEELPPTGTTWTSCSSEKESTS